MKTKKTLEIILNSIVIALFLGAGIFTIIMEATHEEYSLILLGTILVVAGVVKIISYVIKKGYQNPTTISFVAGVVMAIFSIFFFVGKYGLRELCLAWGVMEIALGLVELQIDLFAVRKEKLALVEVAIDLGSITFGVLLTIHLEEGLDAHLLYLGASYIAYSILYTIELILETREHHK